MNKIGIKISLMTKNFISDYQLTIMTDNQRREFIMSLITSGNFEGEISSQYSDIFGNILVTIYTKNYKSEKLCYDLMQNFRDTHKK
jgi:hypothetical protein